MPNSTVFLNSALNDPKHIINFSLCNDQVLIVPVYCRLLKQLLLKTICYHSFYLSNKAVL